jgi:cytochrome c556
MRIGGFVRAAAVGATLAVGLSSLMLAGADPVPDRQAAMKDVGQQMKDAAGLNSAATFDAAKAKTLMGAVAADVKKAAGLFPAGSGADPKTLAAPAIWENNADFTKRLTDLAALATTASNATTFEAYGPAFKSVGATCKSCHDIYRKKPN